MRKIFIILTAVLCVLGYARYSQAASTQVDALIEKLVEKGILSKTEAIKIKGEIINDTKTLSDDSMKSSLPKWVQDMKLKGDFRLRFQYERKEADAHERLRGRIRYRLGLEAPVNDKLKVAAGLASGADDPRSTNQSFTDTFERSDVRLDYAYGEYAPYKWVKMAGGIFPKKDYMWTPTDMLWDSDINIQGTGFHFEAPIPAVSNLTGYINTGVLVLDEVSNVSTYDKADPFMHYAQGGAKWSNDSFDANVAGIYYGFNALKGTCPDWSAGSNTGIITSASGSCSSGALKYDYDSMGTSIELGMINPFGLPVERMFFVADFIQNLYDTPGQNILYDSGYALGMGLGDKKVENWGKWQARYLYVNLGRDAFVDFTPDSDRYGGRTDVRSHEIALDLGLSKNVSFGIDYYYSEKIDDKPVPEHILQGDINMKF